MSVLVSLAVRFRFAVASGFVRIAPAPLGGLAVRLMADAAQAADARFSA